MESLCRVMSCAGFQTERCEVRYKVMQQNQAKLKSLHTISSYAATVLIILLISPQNLFGSKYYSEASVITTENCIDEMFNASCASTGNLGDGYHEDGSYDVIVIKSALYGRMSSGRCVKMEYGPRTCQDDVTSLLDEECSGKSYCQFPVSRLLFVKPCPPDLTSYLEVSYRCISVTPTKCPEQKTLTSPTGHVALPSSTHSDICSWVIELDVRQRIRFSLYAFGPWAGPNGQRSGSSTTHGLQGCSGLMTFEEEPRERGQGLKNGEFRREEPTCRTGARPTLLYESKSHRVRLTYRQNAPSVTGRYILNYEAIGCPTLKPWKDRNARISSKSKIGGNGLGEMYIVHHDDMATVKCNHTDETWFLTCTGHHWKGDLGNCSAPILSQETAYISNKSAPDTALSYGLVSAVFIGILLGVIIGSVPLALAYFCLKRRWRNLPLSKYPHENVYDSEMHKMVDEEGRPICNQTVHCTGDCTTLYPPFHPGRTPSRRYPAGPQTVLPLCTDEEQPCMHEAVEYCFGGSHCPVSGIQMHPHWMNQDLGQGIRHDLPQTMDSIQPCQYGCGSTQLRQQFSPDGETTIQGTSKRDHLYETAGTNRDGEHVEVMTAYFDSSKHGRHTGTSCIQT